MKDYPFYVVGDGSPEDIKAQQSRDQVKKQLERVEQKSNDYKALFGSEIGKRVLEDLNYFCLLNSLCFSPDPYQTAFNEGARNVALYIKAQMEYQPK